MTARYSRPLGYPVRLGAPCLCGDCEGPGCIVCGTPDPDERGYCSRHCEDEDRFGDETDRQIKAEKEAQP